jgi:hypothetical protein
MSAATPETVHDPAERLFREDLEQAPFTSGEQRGYWTLIDVSWPFAIIEISARPSASGPSRFHLRFDLSGYPQAPTAQPWDHDAGAPLAPGCWPDGGPRVKMAFNPGWNTTCLYLPVDRIALEGHDGWRQLPGGRAWDPAGDITQYLSLVHELLNSGSYSGVRG